MGKWILTLVFLCLLLGCNKSSTLDTSTLTGEEKKEAYLGEVQIRTITKYIRATDWLALTFIVAGVVSVMTALRGCKDGWLFAAGSAGGWLWVRADQALQQHQWLLIFPIAVALFEFGRYIWRDYIGKKAYKEKIKNAVPSPSTVKLEEQYKKEINKKEKA